MIKQFSAFDPNKDYTGTFVYVFAFSESFGIPYCHCTHKYLGEAPPELLEVTKTLVDNYFLNRYRDLQQERLWWFDRFAQLGPERDTPVLERRNSGDMLLDLKQQLDEVIPDKWDSYRPHITVPMSYASLKLPMKPMSYQLREGAKIVKEWTFGRGR